MCRPPLLAHCGWPKLSGLHFGTIRTPWGHPWGAFEQQDGQGLHNRIFSDLGTMRGTHCERFLCIEEKDSGLFFGLVARSPFVLVFAPNPNSRAFKSGFSYKLHYKTNCFCQSRTPDDFRTSFECVCDASGRVFSDFCCPAVETGLHLDGFSGGGPDPTEMRWAWQRRGRQLKQ